MKRILFICLGNSERSVIAEELYKKEGGNCFSAGMQTTKSLRNPFMYKLLEEEDINIDNKEKVQFNENMMNEADKIFILCEAKHCPIYLIESEKSIFWDIPDPWGKDEEFLRGTKDLIKKHLLKI